MSTSRNGRHPKEISIYNYPEHLNPFYKEDQHWRLKSWSVNKLGLAQSGSTASMRGSLKNLQSKRSSTLGIYKTSESPSESPRRQVDETRIESFRSTTTSTGSRSLFDCSVNNTLRDWNRLQFENKFASIETSTSMVVGKLSFRRNSTNPFESDDEMVSQDFSASSVDTPLLKTNILSAGWLADLKSITYPNAGNSKISANAIQPVRSVNVNPENDNDFAIESTFEVSRFGEKRMELCTNPFEAEYNAVRIPVDVVPKDRLKHNGAILIKTATVKTDESNVLEKDGSTIRGQSLLTRIRKTLNKSHQQNSKYNSQIMCNEPEQLESAKPPQNGISAPGNMSTKLKPNSKRVLETAVVLNKASNIVKMSNRIRRINLKRNNAGAEDRNNLRIVEDGEEELLDVVGSSLQEQHSNNKFATIHRPGIKPLLCSLVEPIKVSVPDILNDVTSEVKADEDIYDMNSVICFATIHRPGIHSSLYRHVKPIKILVPEITEVIATESKVRKNCNEIKISNILHESMENIENNEQMEYKQNKEKVCKKGEKRKSVLGLVRSSCSLELPKRFKLYQKSPSTEDLYNTQIYEKKKSFGASAAVINKRKSRFSKFTYKGRNMTRHLTPFRKEKYLCLNLVATILQNCTKHKKSCNEGLCKDKKLSHNQCNGLQTVEESNAIDGVHSAKEGLGSFVVSLQSEGENGKNTNEHPIFWYQGSNPETIDLAKKNWQYPTLKSFLKRSTHDDTVKAIDTNSGTLGEEHEIKHSQQDTKIKAGKLKEMQAVGSKEIIKTEFPKAKHNDCSYCQ